MATTLIQLQAQLDTLRRARGSGVLTVEDGGKRITYRSMDELEKAIGAVTQDIARMTATDTNPVPARTMRSSTGKGL
ncbi:MAG TPA: hypothetical protein VEC60_09440 [Reyranella sp.]|nr:hypothetical protein [Reyranella sp.]